MDNDYIYELTGPALTTRVFFRQEPTIDVLMKWTELGREDATKLRRQGWFQTWSLNEHWIYNHE